VIDPDFRLSDDEDAFLDVYETYWAIWKGVFKQPARSRLFNEINRHLYVMEFRIVGADADELIEAFQSEHRSFVRKAYGTHDQDQHHFGVAYLAADADSADPIIRALVLVHPRQIVRFTAAIDAIGKCYSNLTVRRCHTDAGDPDAQWRWLANGILIARKADHTMQGYVQPI